MPLPIVLGHEGAGIVEAVGSAVEKVAPGDHVAVSFLNCGQCRPCFDGSPASCANFNDMNFAGQRPDGSHALTIADSGDRQRCTTASSASPRSRPTPSPTSATRSRSVTTRRSSCSGHSAAGSRPVPAPCCAPSRSGAGATFAVTGAGAVGLSAVMAAQVAGATTIIAVDVVPSRLDLARELGATHVINGREADAVEEIHRITGSGVDYALDTTGLPALIRQAVDALRQRGTAAILGASRPDATLDIAANAFMQSCKTIMGVVEGDSVPDVFVPQLLDLYMQGRFPFDRLVKFYDFDQINQAADDAESGATVKPILRIA